MILVIDDDDRVRAVAQLVLQRAGHEVVTVSSPHDALLVLEARHDVNVALIDIVLPEMIGFDLADEVRRIAPNVRVIFMSGFMSDQFRKEIREPFLVKPFTVESLTSAIDEAIGGGPAS